MKFHILLIAFLHVGFISLSAQNSATNIEIQNEQVFISSTEDIRLSTGSSGKAYYNNQELAVKSESGRSATIIIAASNASERSKAGADYVCTGDNDHLIIQQVLDELKETGGSISFSEGTFYFQSQVIPSGKIKMSGQGSATIFTGKEPYYKSHLGMIMCGDDLELNISDMTFVGDDGGLKAITYLYGPLWGSTNVVSVGKNIKQITLQNLSFENFQVRPIEFSGKNAMVENVIVKGVVLRNVPDLSFDQINNLIFCDVFKDDSFPNDNGRILFLENIQKLIVNNVISGSEIQIRGTGVISSCICTKINLRETSKACIAFGNKTTSGIINSGTNNHIFNNYQ